jgi:phage terminase large subunit-like protein
MHLTGRYPDWWAGKRWDRPVIWWAAGVTGESTRDNPQRLLMGRPGSIGTGSIPKSCIVDHTRATHGVTDLLDTVTVKHISGGNSTLAFKFYEKGREKWQGETLDGVWFDEEPPQDIYSEGLTRTNATGGIVYLTCTPLMGMTEVIRSFLLNPTPQRSVTKMGIAEAEHYTPEQRQIIIDSYPLHEREARSNGTPILGSGRVFPVAEETIREDGIAIPDHWGRICWLDFGWDHPTAAAWLAYDRDADFIHLYDCYRSREQTPLIHAGAIKPRGSWIPVAWPHDGLQHDKGSGLQLAEQYRAQGLPMLEEKATSEDGTNGLEAGIMELLDRMQTGRFKAAAHLNDFWEEYRLYHREDGLIVKVGDDVISAIRYGLMMLRYAITKPRKKESQRAFAGAGGWMG